MAVAELNEAKQEAFAGRMVQVLNDACLGLMAGLGHESGLFDAMAAWSRPPVRRSPAPPA